MSPRFVPSLIATALLCAGLARAEDFQGSTHVLPYEEGVIKYGEQTPSDPVAKLQAALETGEAKLQWDDKFGYLPAVLDALKVPRSSQMLVFSKTSLQRRAITPENPRALYFNDDVYIGFIPDAPAMEISGVDPKLGAVFYTLEQEKVRRPHITRGTDCLTCHASGRSMGVPGHLMRSVATEKNGELAGDEAESMDHCTPYAERWAGWYVTGQHGNQAHRGNLVGPADFLRHQTEPTFNSNLAKLDQFFDPAKYVRPGSDITALMVLAHETHMHNYITRLNYETQSMVATYGHIRYLKSQVNGFLRYLLFAEEAPLTGPVSGDPEFANDFSAGAIRDSKGRSLRDFDLQTRLFKYPCSYLIYASAFDSLPAVMREHLLQRLFDILTGKDPDPQFAKIAANDRTAVLDILRETKKNLPTYWRE
jgi:hypothetical protein